MNNIEQFPIEQKEEFDILGGKFEAVDIKPENQKTEVPVVFAPGWSCTIETYKDSLKTLAEKQRRVLSVKHSRRGGDTEKIDPELQKQYPVDELRKALTILNLLDEKKIKKADVIAHSEGAINTIIAASLNPEKFRNIVLVNPAGMIGKDKFPALTGRFSLSMLRGFLKSREVGGEEKPRFSRMLKELTEYIAKNPLRALKEGAAISKTEIHQMLKDLRGKGIGIAVIAGVDDSVFPMDRMQEATDSEELDGFLSVKGGHTEIITHPEKYAAAAEELLTKLEKKYDR